MLDTIDSIFNRLTLMDAYCEDEKPKMEEIRLMLANQYYTKRLLKHEADFYKDISVLAADRAAAIHEEQGSKTTAFYLWSSIMELASILAESYEIMDDDVEEAI